MTDPTPVLHDPNGSSPHGSHGGFCVSAIAEICPGDEKVLPGGPKGGSPGTPGDKGGTQETTNCDDLGWLGEEGDTTSLDPEKHPCNEDDDCEDCRLPDEELPQAEWQCIPLSKEESSFWFSGCRHERKCVYEALILSGNRKALHRFVNCGGRTRVFVQGRIGDQFTFRVVAFGCHNRYCPRCARNRSSNIGRNVKRLLRGNDGNLKFVTLTLRHNKTDLRDQLKRLNSCFNNMKRRDWWKSHVTGGMMFIEVKLSRAKQWHVHAHIIADAKYMPQHELSKEWLAVTGDSPIVDVRLIKNADAAASYVAKYGSKSFDAGLIHQPESLAKVMTALKGSRLCTTFGTWRGKKLTSPDKNEDDGEWQDLGDLREFSTSDLFDLFAEQHPELAERILKCLGKKKWSG